LDPGGHPIILDDGKRGGRRREGKTVFQKLGRISTAPDACVKKILWDDGGAKILRWGDIETGSRDWNACYWHRKNDQQLWQVSPTTKTEV